MTNVASSGSTAHNNRVLVIDDNHAIHADVRKILCPVVSAAAASLDALEAELLGDSSAAAATASPARATPAFLVDSAYQGREGLELVQKAVASNQLPSAPITRAVICSTVPMPLMRA